MGVLEPIKELIRSAIGELFETVLYLGLLVVHNKQLVKRTVY